MKKILLFICLLIGMASFGQVVLTTNNQQTVTNKTLYGTQNTIDSIYAANILNLVDSITAHAGAGGSTLIGLSGTNTATGDVTGDLDGNTLQIVNGIGTQFLQLNAVSGSEFSLFGSVNSSGYSYLNMFSNSSDGYFFTLETSDGINTVNINADAVAQTITLTADSIVNMGKVGIGTSPSVALDVYGDVLGGKNGTYTLGLIGTIVASGYAFLGDWQGGGNNTFISVDDGNGVVDIEGGVFSVNNLSGTGTRAVLADGSGILSAPVSDMNAKFNIQQYQNGLNAVMNTDPVNFFYKEKYQHFGTTQQIGFIAQDIKKILPNSVYYNKDGTMGYNEFDLIPVLWSAVQELQQQINEIKNK